MRIIDMECSISGLKNETAAPADPAPRATGRAGYGMANYGRIFKSRAEGSPREAAVPVADLIAKTSGLGVEKSVVFGVSNDQQAEILEGFPDRFLGLARLSAWSGMAGVRELEFRVREQGFRALGVSALVDKLPAGDRRYYPLYGKAAELGVPVRIYSSMSYANDTPYDLGHPRNLDQIAIDFPELKIIGGLGGWPWVNEMVALVRRHPNLHLDTSAHRPKYFAETGTGWDMLMRFGNSLIQDKVLVGLSAVLIGQSYETLIQEYLDLPLKDAVKEKWLYGNAARLFELD